MHVANTLLLQEPNHSHFVFVDSGVKAASENPTDFSKEFGKEIAVRANFEAAVAANYPIFRQKELVIRPHAGGHLVTVEFQNFEVLVQC
jgi:hypothetical protein